ncbi:MAG: uL22 family ribosomal protein [Minisyncoccales bacterium]
MANTEKPTTKAEQKKNSVSQETKVKKKKETKIEKKKELKKEIKDTQKEESKKEIKDTQKEDTQKEKKPLKKDTKIKKTSAKVNISSAPISTKDSISICRFIKNKSIDNAINNLEEVLNKKRAIPMKGEIPHRKGRIMSGRYPKKASEVFIKALNSLKANSENNGIKEPIILSAIANFASRPMGKFGRTKKKRTHIYLTSIEKSELKKKTNKKKIKSKNKK